MAVSSVNNLISLQESQLIQLLAQQSARARTEGNAENRKAWQAAQGAESGQNLPGQPKAPGINDQPAADEPLAAFEPIDPALSPDNINALLLEMQTQQASLDTTLLLGGSTAGPGGRTLVDYLTSPENIAADAANDDGALSGTETLA